MSEKITFNNQAKDVLAKARQISVELKNEYISSDHLLYEIMLQDQSNIPLKIAFSDNSDKDSVLEVIKNNNTPIAKDSDFPQISDELNSSLILAIKIAEEYNYNYVGIEHMLYGILETKNSQGLDLLKLRAVDLKSIKVILTTMFSSYSELTY